MWVCWNEIYGEVNKVIKVMGGESIWSQGLISISFFYWLIFSFSCEICWLYVQISFLDKNTNIANVLYMDIQWTCLIKMLLKSLTSGCLTGHNIICIEENYIPYSILSHNKQHNRNRCQATIHTRQHNPMQSETVVELASFSGPAELCDISLF